MTLINLSEQLHVYGYHGTSLEAAQGIIEQGFNISTNDSDWSTPEEDAAWQEL